ncbi:MAG TPA: hypothetical protein VI055_10175 [Rubrobacter sp.]|jgi:hypothetical protein
MTSSRLIRWGATAAVVAALLGGAVALVQFLLGPIGGYRCDEPAKALVDIGSMDDLRGRFNEDAGSPRLVLLLSPT